MAVDFTSAEAVHQSTSQNDNFSITVPAAAEAIIVIATGYIDSGTDILDKLNFDDSAPIDFDVIATQAYTTSGATDDQAITAFIMTDTNTNWPGVGAATLYYSTSGAVLEGFNILAYYVEGLDTASPIIDTDSQEGSDSGYGSSTWTSALVGVSAGDLSFMSAYHYQTGLNVNPTGSSQTVVVTSSDINNNVLGVSYKDGEPAMEVQGDWRVSIAFALKQAVVSGVSISVIMNSYRQRRV